jgi:hypothetical protein
MSNTEKLSMEQDLKETYGLVTAAFSIAAPDDVTKNTLIRAILARAIDEQGGDSSKMIVSIHAHAHLEHAEVSESHNPVAVASAPMANITECYEQPTEDIKICA